MAHSTKTFVSSTLLAAAVSLASVGCGPIAPVSPSWKTDVRPLIVARCLRCHDGSGKGDPSVTNSTSGHGYNFNVSEELPSPLPPGLTLLKSVGPDAVRGKKPYMRRMPPPPLEALQDWQIDIIDGWAINSLP